MTGSKIYWKDIKQSFTKSKGRALSIVSLMALGSFAYVGLSVSGPNIRTTGQEFFNQHQTADLFVLSNYGLDAEDTERLKELDGKATVEFGYLKDVVMTESQEALRIFSNSGEVSRYELVAGRLPKTSNEIALASSLQDDYKIGDKLTIEEKENAEGESVLTEETFTVVGFVNSSEILAAINQGQSTAGSGELKGYAVVPEETFDSEVYMMARIAYDDLTQATPYAGTYLDRMKTEKAAVKALLADRPEDRLADIKAEVQVQLDAAASKIATAKKDLVDGRSALDKAAADLKTKEGQLAGLAEQIAAMEAAGLDPMSRPDTAQAKTVLNQLAEAKAELAKQEQSYQEKAAEAQVQLAEKDKELKEAQAQLDSLEEVNYQVLTRREIPGSEGYVSYDNNASIIDAVSKIFPVVLYFVAALVTGNTMARFVDEERLKAGTLRALGYDTRSVRRKFLLYGGATSLLGTLIGTIAGHLLLPSIIYKTYSVNLLLPPMQLHFYPLTTLIAVLLGLLSALLPAYWVSKQTLAEKPARLLLPKPPVAGEKILLEKLPFIWKRLNFTQKVTARNIFRYKQRMLMTIFGVAGSVALLFAGLAVRQSIGDLSERQFSHLITYDLIVADKDYLTEDDKKARDELLRSSAIDQQLPIHYEVVTKVAGDMGDEQEINLMAVADAQSGDFGAFIGLRDRQSGEELELDGQGVILSEKLAQLLGLEVGDTLTVEADNGDQVDLPVAGLTEMYIGHFAFLTQSAYEAAFGENLTTNATMLTIKDDEHTVQVAEDFMALESTKGVVQNTTSKHMAKTIVDALGKIMFILIGTSVLLAIVILYNLTNINVAERLRELSTIKVLGFFDQEVTLYIYRETIVLSLVGILTGFGLGRLLTKYMLDVIPPASLMFNPTIPWPIYVVPAAVVIVILTLLGLMVNRWLKRIDMLEALKSVE